MSVPRRKGPAIGSTRETYRVWSEPEKLRLAAMVAEHKTAPMIAKALGRTASSVRQYIRKAGVRAPGESAPPASASVSTPDVTTGSDRTVSSPLTTAPITLERLLAIFEIDPAEWEASELTPNVWQMGAKHPETGQILTAPLYQLKARLKRKVSATMEALKVALLEDITADTAQRPRYRFKQPTRPESAERYMAEVETADLHLGKMAWGEETGTDYDSGIAESLARAHVAELLWHAERYPIEQFVLPVGNDLLHHELSGNTTAGTPQDADTRWLKMFRRARGVISWMIATLAERAPVHVMIVAGNHARQGEMALGEVLAAEYASDSRVTFDASPAPRKYYVYGKNLLGLTHGDGEPHAKLPQLMAVEQPILWGETTHREYHVGHLHTQRRIEPVTVDDKLGVTVRILRSLSGVDAWHASKGYIGTRGAEAFIWRRSGGIVAHFMSYATSAERAA